MPALNDTRRRALLALLLLAPVPTLGVAVAMVIAPGPAGRALFTAAKIWLVAFPAFWHLIVERRTWSWSPPTRGGLLVGAATGLVVAGIIVAASWLTDVREIDLTPLKNEADEMGLGAPSAFLAAAAAWTFINSLVEEYVYRWFVFRQLEVLVGGAWAVVGSAAVFTAHHVVAVSTYLSPGLAALASAGVFIGGLVWSWLYRRYRSIWPGWISHVLADIAVFGVGWMLLFG
jgi:membrane protease YdiL (CAAX protease family)